MRRLAIPAAALAAAGLAALPATGAASSFKFGAKLNVEPSNSAPPHTCSQDGGDISSPCTRVLVSSETGLASGNLTSPKDGVLTKFKIRAGAAGFIRFKIVRLKNLNVANGTAQGKAIVKSKLFQVAGNGFNSTNAVESFTVNLGVKKGDYIGVDGQKTSALRCTSGSTRQLIWAPPLKIGDPFSPNDAKGNCTLMVQALGHT